MDVYRGTVVHCLRPQEMELLPDHLIGVENGQVRARPSACEQTEPSTIIPS